MSITRTNNIRRGGFTLVEALLSTILAAMIAVLILAAYNSTIKHAGVLMEQSERYAQVRYAMDHMRTDLANFYRCSERQNMLLRGQTDATQVERADRILFHAMRMQTSSEGCAMTGPWEVEYGLYPDPTGGSSFIGCRSVLASEADSGAQKGTITPLAGNIREFRVEYFDQNQWNDEWRKTDSFPSLIRITATGGGGSKDDTSLSISEVISLAPLPVLSASSSLSVPTEPAPHETQTNP